METANATQTEIAALEDRLRLAELGPDPQFFKEVLDDNAILVSNGEPTLAKAKVVESHQPGTGPKFTSVEMSDLRIVDHGIAAVVTCKGIYKTPQSSTTLSFMRVWVKKDSRWQIVAG